MSPPREVVFEDAHFGAVSFTGRDNSKREVVEQGEQTVEIQHSCGSTQTHRTVVVEVCCSIYLLWTY